MYLAQRLTGVQLCNKRNELFIPESQCNYFYFYIPSASEPSVNFFLNLASLLSVDSIFSVIFTRLYVVELSETGLKTNSTTQMYERRVLIQWL